ncbi:MAG TPA: thioredoxin fold domain-containing protein [Chthonomonadales bacterium]|nr:thioredoxin fold domain-containing protein [Chthonomonadales bacterium]
MNRTSVVYFGSLAATALALQLAWGAPPAAKKKAAHAAPAHAAAIVWSKDLAHAFGVARKARKPLMIDFYTDWCGYCKLMDRSTYMDSQVETLARNYVTAKVNPEKDPAARKVAIQARINEFPTILFVRPNGDVLFRAVGYRSASRFSAEMGAVLKRFHKS